VGKGNKNENRLKIFGSKKGEEKKY